jgi:hypothetical protein
LAGGRVISDEDKAALVAAQLAGFLRPANENAIKAKWYICVDGCWLYSWDDETALWRIREIFNDLEEAGTRSGAAAIARSGTP